MASTNQFLITLAIVSIVLPTVAFATDYTVGDSSGWTANFDYAAWAKGKEFYVGDTLVFKYLVGLHNVFKVNGTVFQECAIPSPTEALATGNDVITLATPGMKWYFCGVAEHCKGGQKLAITVWPAMVAPTLAPSSAFSYQKLSKTVWTATLAPAPAPAPNSANGIATSGFYVLLAAAVSFAMMIMA